MLTAPEPTLERINIDTERCVMLRAGGHPRCHPMASQSLGTDLWVTSVSCTEQRELCELRRAAFRLLWWCREFPCDSTARCAFWAAFRCFSVAALDGVVQLAES